MTDGKGGRRRVPRLVLAAFVAASAFTAAGSAHAEKPRAGAPIAEAAGGKAGGNVLPQVIGEQDAARYRRIFDLQEKGSWRSADREIRKLRSRLLMGHVLGQRYLHPTKYRSAYGELERWLRYYADHPEARRIYRLAMRRKGKSSRRPRAPTSLKPRVNGVSSFSPTYGYTSPRKRSASARKKVYRRIRDIRRHAFAGRLKRSQQIFAWRSTRRMLDPTRDRHRTVASRNRILLPRRAGDRPRAFGALGGARRALHADGVLDRRALGLSRRRL